MKMPYATLALLTGASVVCSSCVVPDTGYASYTVPGSVNAGAVWTNASYDANGFPIFGYSYGRPVYGYTSTGAAIFTIAALTALCYVPYWGPARWYRGPYHYPRGVHRVPAPPAFPRGHQPGMRPPGGIQPPPPGGARPPAPGSALSPIPSSPAMRGPGPAFSTMPAPGGVRVAPTPGAIAPGAGGMSIPKPISPSVSSPKPAFSTMPAPNGMKVAPVPGAVNPGVGGVSIPKPTSSGVSSPKVSTMPASGGFSIPKPVGVSAPTTVRTGPPAASSGGSTPAISPMRASVPMPRGAH